MYNGMPRCPAYAQRHANCQTGGGAVNPLKEYVLATALCSHLLLLNCHHDRLHPLQRPLCLEEFCIVRARELRHRDAPKVGVGEDEVVRRALIKALAPHPLECRCEEGVAQVGRGFLRAEAWPELARVEQLGRQARPG